MLSIRLAIDGTGGRRRGRLRRPAAWRVAAWSSRRGAASVLAGAVPEAVCNGVGCLAASASVGLGAAGVGRMPPGGSFGVSGPGSSFSGWTGTVLAWMRL